MSGISEKGFGAKYGFYKTIRADAFRYHGSPSVSLVESYIRFIEFRYIFWMRLAAYTRTTKTIRIFHYIARSVLYRMKIKYGISIPYNTKIGPGFYIGHIGGIVVHPKVRIGRNCNISNRVTIGLASRGDREGVPVIGDEVYIGTGAVVIGAIHIGNKVAIGANCVVTKNVPANAVIVGVPGKIISENGSAGYISNTGYCIDPTCPP